MSEGHGDGTVAAEVVVSVRGEAVAAVDPDMASVHLGLTVTAGSKSEASVEAGKLLESVVSSLAALGGKARTAETDKDPLTWATTSVRSHPEFNHNREMGPVGPTGRTVAAAQFEVRVRDFGLLPSLQAVLDAHPSLETYSVDWHVDPGNPAWRLVRADAIRDAIARGQDYANALGGELDRIEQLADTGLLAGADRLPGRTQLSAAGGMRPGTPQPPPLDPLPQVLSAVVEARFIAAGITLKRT